MPRVSLREQVAAQERPPASKVREFFASRPELLAEVHDALRNEPRLTVMAVFRVLRDEHGAPFSYPRFRDWATELPS